jgi:hypothetical protein
MARLVRAIRNSTGSWCHQRGPVRDLRVGIYPRQTPVTPLGHGATPGPDPERFNRTTISACTCVHPRLNLPCLQAALRIGSATDEHGCTQIIPDHHPLRGKLIDRTQNQLAYLLSPNVTSRGRRRQQSTVMVVAIMHHANLSSVEHHGHPPLQDHCLTATQPEAVNRTRGIAGQPRGRHFNIL